MVISRLQWLLLLLIPISAASAAGAVYYVTVVKAVTPCEALKYSVSQEIVTVQNTWNKPTEVGGVAASLNYTTPTPWTTQPFTLQPGQSQVVWEPFIVNSNVGREALNLEMYTFASSTNVTLDIRNTGGTSSVPDQTDNFIITSQIDADNTVYTCQHSVQVYVPGMTQQNLSPTSLVTYYVKDAGGNQYSKANWSTGPSSTPNELMTANIVIGSSCPTCALSGSPFTFQSGSSYTIIVITGRNNQFVFTVVR